MLKKLAVATVCFSCLNAIADQSPFGIGIGQFNIKEIPQNIISKQAVTSTEDIVGYKEINLNPANFALNGHYPSQAKLYVDSAGVIEAIIVDYDANNVELLTSDLDRKYPRTYSRQTFYGSHDIEYRNRNCLIRIIKSFGRGTRLMYGTISWFEKYDTCYNQLDEIREKRREYAASQPTQKRTKQARKTRKKRSTRVNPWKQLFQEFGMFDDSNDFFSDAPKKRRRNKSRRDFFSDFEDFDEMFKMPNHMNKCDKNCDVKVYRTSQSYSKDGDREEWIYDDNGKITKVVKTPEGTRVSHDGEPEKFIEKKVKPVKNSKEKEYNLKLYGQMIDDVNL